MCIRDRTGTVSGTALSGGIQEIIQDPRGDHSINTGTVTFPTPFTSTPTIQIIQRVHVSETPTEANNFLAWNHHPIAHRIAVLARSKTFFTYVIDFEHGADYILDWTAIGEVV